MVLTKYLDFPRMLLIAIWINIHLLGTGCDTVTVTYSGLGDCRGKTGTNFIVSISEGLTLLECAGKCLQASRCLTISYNSRTRVCSLHTRKSNAINMATDDYSRCFETNGVVGVGSASVNKYAMPSKFACPLGHSINQLVSQYSDEFEDRQWDLSCQKTLGMGSCKWTGYENESDQELYFQCSGQSIIGGISSVFDKNCHDRRFKFFCCKLNDIKLNNCRFTGYVNDWDAYFNYTVPSGHVLRGASSYHMNSKEDRRWKFEICSVRLPQKDK